MIYKTVLAAITFLLLSLSIAPDATAQAAGQSHTVQQGETLFSISRLYDVTVGDLRRWNRLESDVLTPGQELLVGPPRNDDSVVHTVESGQTLFAISRLYDVTIAEIQSWNNLEGTQLSEGQELIIFQVPQDEDSEPEDLSPQSEDTEPRESIIRDREGTRGTTYYTVRSGDTLTRIARLHDMTVDQLRELNNLQSDMLSIGQRLTVRDVQTAPSIADGAEESTPQGKFVSYRLESGESAVDLQDKFMMSEDELTALNPDLDIESLQGGQRVTVLLPPSRNFSNPFKKGASLENLGEIPVSRYSDRDRANPTTSGELYNPDYLTAGHSNMPLGNVIYVENPETGQGVYVRINDRTSGSGIMLSHKAFEMLGFSSIQRSSVVVYLDQ
ncbi:LysM peptidoglycan-binding domain-containing protein [Rhodohalobacter sp. 8-1]|uniref:LysM peptidoglycan-binding domain-containing protein n=1 Tax=Rhodohalobacter sp. 8-1 TaxID=3131972 RepID=UPI0030ED3B39